MFGTVIQSFEIFANDDDIYLLEAAAMQDHVRRAQTSMMPTCSRPIFKPRFSETLHFEARKYWAPN